MRVPRIYIDQPLQANQDVSISDDAFHHLVNVLRMGENDAICLFNGDGHNYPAIISSKSKKVLVAQVAQPQQQATRSPIVLHLGQVVSRGDRMEITIQKAVELGVTHITPLLSERCGVKLAADRWQKKVQQWHKIIIGACEQSGRTDLPLLVEPMELNDWLTQPFDGTRLTLHPHAQQTIAQLPPAKGFQLLIGPEGGFSDAEVSATEQQGFSAVRLGPRVLRTETAALTVISILQHQFGDLAL